MLTAHSKIYSCAIKQRLRRQKSVVKDENLMIIHAVDYFLNIGDERRRIVPLIDNNGGQNKEKGNNEAIGSDSCKGKAKMIRSLGAAVCLLKHLQNRL
jgi:hypothetical protein